MSQFFTSGGQSISVSALALVFPMNIQDWLPLGWTGRIFLLSKGLARVLSKPQFKSINSLMLSFLHSQLSHPYMTTRKTIALTRWTFVGKVMSLLFNMLSRLITAFLPRIQVSLFHGCSHHLHWFGAPPKKSFSLFPLFPHLFAWSDETECHDLHFLNVEF